MRVQPVPLHSLCHDLYLAVCHCYEDYIVDIAYNSSKKVDEKVFKINTLNLNKALPPSYTYPNSEEILRVALEIEKQLVFPYFLDHNNWGSESSENSQRKHHY